MFIQGQTAALPCRVQSVPPPTLSWFYVNSNLLQPVPITLIIILLLVIFLILIKIVSWFYVNSNLLQPVPNTLIIILLVILIKIVSMVDVQVSYSPRVHSVAHMLLVTEAQGGDAGQYRCTARNEVRW